MNKFKVSIKKKIEQSWLDGVRFELIFQMRSLNSIIGSVVCIQLLANLKGLQ